MMELIKNEEILQNAHFFAENIIFYQKKST